jgi:hypothetical protein
MAQVQGSRLVPVAHHIPAGVADTSGMGP